MTEFVRQQDEQQGRREGPPEHESTGMLDQPRPRPHIPFVCDEGKPIVEILHEAGTDGRGGDDAKQEQNAWYPKAAPSGCTYFKHESGRMNGQMISQGKEPAPCENGLRDGTTL